MDRLLLSNRNVGVRRRLNAHLLAVTLIACTIQVSAANAIEIGEFPTAPSLNVKTSAQIMAASEAQAAKGPPSTIVIVDNSGTPILVQRMDGAAPASYEVAVGKARAAAAFGRSTRTLEDATNQGRFALLSSGFVVMQGGVPLTIGKTVIGAIGVSGGTKDQDEDVAKAGAALLP